MSKKAIFFILDLSFLMGIPFVFASSSGNPMPLLDEEEASPSATRASSSNAPADPFSDDEVERFLKAAKVGAQQENQSAIDYFLSADRQGRQDVVKKLFNRYFTCNSPLVRAATLSTGRRIAYDVVQKVAENGGPETQYQFGEVQESLENKDQYYWYEKAAQKGHVEAQYRLGLSLSARAPSQSQADSSIAIKKQKETMERNALFWMKCAAKQGYGEAQCRLGLWFESGREGLQKDVGKAIKWYKKVAEQHVIKDPDYCINARNGLLRMTADGEAAALYWAREVLDTRTMDMYGITEKALRQACEEGLEKSASLLSPVNTEPSSRCILL